MVKLFRGDVILAWGPDGQGGLKKRPLIVFQNTQKNSDIITVYCTTQNNGDDENNILVKVDSPEGRLMEIEEDTYIRPLQTGPISHKFFVRKLGKSSLMTEINRIIEKRMASR